eukprot:CAMPEP_0113897438 /NCGR_PEP_ID=MMETSP0780_2-20120614/18677_1 /TAXON_ID=652834 /ORGANISM="Palpitomonas bilix" /LENGTH=487 /DNA_ID=CAMNT_0000888897 /DNA_START=369 /DNA_END=1832 /DNA_ORIENTATION=- /assembly_acc=CAM_ASM_000599
MVKEVAVCFRLAQNKETSKLLFFRHLCKERELEMETTSPPQLPQVQEQKRKRDCIVSTNTGSSATEPSSPPTSDISQPQASEVFAMVSRAKKAKKSEAVFPLVDVIGGKTKTDNIASNVSAPRREIRLKDLFDAVTRYLCRNATWGDVLQQQPRLSDLGEPDYRRLFPELQRVPVPGTKTSFVWSLGDDHLSWNGFFLEEEGFGFASMRLSDLFVFAVCKMIVNVLDACGGECTRPLPCQEEGWGGACPEGVPPVEEPFSVVSVAIFVVLSCLTKEGKLDVTANSRLRVRTREHASPSRWTGQWTSLFSQMLECQTPEGSVRMLSVCDRRNDRLGSSLLFALSSAFFHLQLREDLSGWTSISSTKVYTRFVGSPLVSGHFEDWGERAPCSWPWLETLSVLRENQTSLPKEDRNKTAVECILVSKVMAFLHILPPFDTLMAFCPKLHKQLQYLHSTKSEPLHPRSSPKKQFLHVLHYCVNFLKQNEKV